MLLVVPAKKSLRKCTAILNAPEAVRELRPILHGAKLAFRKWIVVGDVGSTMRFGGSQIGQQQGHGFGSHRGAAIGMQRELASSALSRIATIQPVT